MKFLFKNIFIFTIAIFGMLALPFTTYANINSTPMSIDNTWISSTITNSEQPQYYSITLPSEGILTLNYKSYASTTCWGLYSEDFTTKIFDLEVSGGSDNEAETRSQKYALEAGTYIVKLYCDSDVTNAKVEVRGHFKSVIAEDIEPNDTWSEANQLTAHSTLNAYLSDNDSYDYYKFSVPKSGTVEFDFASELNTLPVSIYSSSGTELEEEYFSNNGDYNISNAPVHTLRISLDAGEYYLKIERFIYRGAYTIKYNNTVPTSAKLNISSLQMLEGDNHSLKVTFLPENAVIPEYEWNSSNSNVADICSYNEVPYIGAFAPGITTISLTTTDGSNLSASFDVVVIPDEVYFFKISETTNSITLRFEKQDGVDGYRVYKYNKAKKKFEKYKDTKSNTLKISKLKAETKYKFKVAAYVNINGKKVFGSNKDSLSFWTAPKCLKGSNITSISTYKRDYYYNYITVKWKKVKGATGYVIYGKTPSGSWQHLDRTKQTSTKLYTGRGYTYSLRVCPYRTKHGSTTYGKWGKVTKYTSR